MFSFIYWLARKSKKIKITVVCKPRLTANLCKPHLTFEFNLFEPIRIKQKRKNYKLLLLLNFVISHRFAYWSDILSSLFVSHCLVACVCMHMCDWLCVAKWMNLAHSFFLIHLVCLLCCSIVCLAIDGLSAEHCF